MFGPVSWGTPVPIHGKHYYPGSYPGNVSLAGTIPVGSHNQFIPLQVSLAGLSYSFTKVEYCLHDEYNASTVKN